MSHSRNFLRMIRAFPDSPLRSKARGSSKSASPRQPRPFPTPQDRVVAAGAVDLHEVLIDHAAGENMAFCACEMQQNGEKTFFSVFLLFCQRFKKQGSVPFFSFIFRFVKRSQLFICFFEAFSAFSLLSNPQKCFIIIKRSAAISRPVCKNGNPGSSQSVLAARPLCGGLGGFVFFKFYRVIGKRSILLC